MNRYQTRVQLDRESRMYLTFGQFETLVDKFREYAEVDVNRNADHIPTSLLVTFEVEDEYQLAIIVRDLEEELRQYSILKEIPRPTVVDGSEKA
jgi:hypothetical protein